MRFADLSDSPCVVVDAWLEMRGQISPTSPACQVRPAEWDNGPGTLAGRVSYYAVDLWQQQGADYNDTANVKPHTQVANLRAAMELLEPFWSSVRLLQEPSTAAAKRFEAGSVDFVYIDARHDFASVLEDLRAWWPKVKAGGMLGGDDYLYSEVKDAVDAFAENERVQIFPFGLNYFLPRGR